MPRRGTSLAFMGVVCNRFTFSWRVSWGSTSAIRAAMLAKGLRQTVEEHQAAVGTHTPEDGVPGGHAIKPSVQECEECSKMARSKNMNSTGASAKAWNFKKKQHGTSTFANLKTRPIDPPVY